MDTTKPVKALTLKQCFSQKQQCGRQNAEFYREIFAISGLLILRSQLLIDVKQKQKQILENETLSYASMINRYLNRLKAKVSTVVQIGGSYEYGETTIRIMTNRSSAKICEVDEQFRLTAEKFGDVIEWAYSPNEPMPAVIGIDAKGNRRAVMYACIVDNR